jgi:tetratricopeptide (TPR) repeat protein
MPRVPSRATDLPKSTISDLLRTGRVGKPALLAFLAACGVPDADMTHWVAAWERARTADLGRPEGAQRARAADPLLLGVHRPIEVEGAQGSLPAYVPRDFDDGPGGIRQKLREAARGGGFVVLLGSSSTGKSRSAYEAVRDLLPDWWLVHPDPDDNRWSEKLSAARIAPTVVWLDQLQQYFEGQSSLTGGHVRALLQADARIVIIGTLWPEWYTEFTALPSNPLGSDRWRRQRDVLHMAEVVRVPDSLSDAEYQRACQLAGTDPLLSAALQYNGHALTQSIAAAPQLMASWHNADAYAMAVLNAAIDARRIGVQGPIPACFLRAAAVAYCDNRAQATAPPDWFESAIGYCTHVLHGAAAALEPVASGMGKVSGYTVAEYLQQHAANERRHIGIPEGAWKAALDNIDDQSLIGRVADALYLAGDVTGAWQLASQALTEDTEPDLLVDLQWTLAQCRMRSGLFAESLAPLDRALASPGISARHRARLLVLSARTHEYLGESDEAGRIAATVLATASEAADTYSLGWALHVLALATAGQGRTTDALRLFDRALTVAQADPALSDLGLLLQINKAMVLGCLDQYEQAIAAAGQARHLADQAGSALRLAQAHSALGQLLFQTGRWDDALAQAAMVPENLKEPLAACCDLGIAAMICFHRGDTGAARRHLAAAVPHAEPMGHRITAPLALARSLDREHSGALPQALQALTASNTKELDEFEDLLADAVRLATATGDLGTAEALAGHAAALAAESEIPHRQASALHCLGLLDHDAPRLLEAAERYDHAGRPLPTAQALEAAAGEFLSSGDPDQAQAASARALQIYASLGAAADIARLKATFGSRQLPMTM